VWCMSGEEVRSELERVFPSVDRETLDALLVSEDESITRALFDSLVALSSSRWAALVGLSGKELDLLSGEAMVGHPVCIHGKPILREVVDPFGTSFSCFSSFVPKYFGNHQIIDDSGRKSFLAQSPVWKLVRAFDLFYDSLYWAPTEWNDELELSVFALIHCIEDDLQPVFEKLTASLSSFGMGSMSMDEAITVVRQDVYTLVSMPEKRAAAIGRLHQSLHQILESQSMMSMIPRGASEIVNNFLRLKVDLSDKSILRQKLECLQDSCREFAEYGTGDETTLILKLSNACTTILKSEQFDFSEIFQIRFSMMIPRLFSSLTGSRPSYVIQLLPYAPLEAFALRNTTESVHLYSERLLGQVIMLSPTFSYPLGKDIEKDSNLIMGVLNAGLAYVASSGSLVSIFGIWRGVLDLRGSIINRKLHDRVKDLSRILRKAGREYSGSISFRINSNFDSALALLRAHHESSWISKELEQVWKFMFEQRQLFFFELWVGESLVGVDAGHFTMHGTSVYIATRAYDPTFRNIQPGFLLAFVETKFLKDVMKVSLWDLGDYDSNPQMAYKAGVSNIISRPEFLFHFWESKKRHNVSELESIDRVLSKGSIIIPEIGPEHLLSIMK